VAITEAEVVSLSDRILLELASKVDEIDPAVEV